MFTGLVQNIGTIKVVDKSGDWRFVIDTDMNLDEAPAGASIMCSGVCLTVIEKGQEDGKHWFSADVSHETLSKTTLGQWGVGTRINLEPSLKLGDELGGHFVFGHVDGLATLVGMEKDQDSWRLTIKPPTALFHYIASKGSVSLDGISLTVNEVGHDTFGVNIIAHTWACTTLQDRVLNDTLNFEVDMLARYVERMMNKPDSKVAA